MHGAQCSCIGCIGLRPALHLRQNNDSKAITIPHEKDLEQIEKPTDDSGNLYGSSALAATL